MEKLRSHVLEGESSKESVLIKNILRKRELLASGDESHQSIKTALIIGGGGVRGAFGAGVGLGLEQAGLRSAFDVVIGVSAGAADLAYFLARQIEIGSTLWYDDCANRRFINLARLTRVLDMDYAADHLMRVVKPLDQDAVRASRSNFYIGVTNAQTGEGELLDAKDGIDIVTAIHASTALPVVYNRTVNINGVEYGDGSIGIGIPIEAALQKGCTDILVVLNDVVKEKVGRATLFEKMLVSLYMRKFTPEFRAAILARHGQYTQVSDVIEHSGNDVNIGIIAPSKMPISRISIDSQAIYDLTMDGKDIALELFEN